MRKLVRARALLLAVLVGAASGAVAQAPQPFTVFGGFSALHVPTQGGILSGGWQATLTGNVTPVVAAEFD